MVLGRRRQAGHQRRHPRTSSTRQGLVLQRPGRSAEDQQSALKDLVTFDKLSDVQKCLGNDKTVIKDLQWKFNYQLNAANKLQYLFQSDNKYRNARDASATTAKEATAQQTSDKPWGLPLPTHSITAHVDRVRQAGLQQPGHLRLRRVLPGLPGRAAAGQLRPEQVTRARIRSIPARAGCLWNIQSLTNRTSGVSSRSSTSVYQTTRHSWEAKTDGTYFLTHTLGGDHSLKFGLGWRRNPIQTFSHYSGGARALGAMRREHARQLRRRQLRGRWARRPASCRTRRCSTATSCCNNNWWTYNGYIQDGYSRGKWRINGGLRYDWQQSKYLGGCVPANVLRPDLLPSQCEPATTPTRPTARRFQSFGNWSPRVSATHDLFGNGKTQVHGNALVLLRHEDHAGQRAERPVLAAGADLGSEPLERRVQHDGDRAAGHDTNSTAWCRPTSCPAHRRRATRRTSQNGVFLPAGNIVDPSAQIRRTREGSSGSSTS